MFLEFYLEFHLNLRNILFVFPSRNILNLFPTRNIHLVVQEYPHPDEGLAALLSQHVPWLRTGQQVRDRALGVFICQRLFQKMREELGGGETNCMIIEYWIVT